ncbi:hypothetical protein VTK26DRAFT_7412 [Humicola hyalothermophila]
MTQQQPIGPFRLVTVNTAPERAKRLIGRVVEDVKDKYIIIHAANAASIDEVRKTVEEERPNLLLPCGHQKKRNKSSPLPRRLCPISRHSHFLRGCKLKRAQTPWSSISRSIFLNCSARRKGVPGIQGQAGFWRQHWYRRRKQRSIASSRIDQSKTI